MTGVLHSIEESRSDSTRQEIYSREASKTRDSSSRQVDDLPEEKWIQRHQLSDIHRDLSDYRDSALNRTCSNTLDVLVAVKYKLQRLEMSDHTARANPGIISRRPPVPCPVLPKTFQTKQTKTGNYSYAEIEFRPMIVTEEGAISAPIQDTAYDKQQDGVTASPTSNLQWDDDLGLGDNRSPYDQDDSSNMHDFEIPHEVTSQMRETVIASDDSEPDEYSNPPEEDYSSEYIYDTPLDTSSQREIDVTQLYAQVDFSAKKKKPPEHDSPEPSRNGAKRHKEPLSNKSSCSGQSDCGNSKFFVHIPDRRGSTPPPIPAPYKGPRKQSAPALFARLGGPEVPPRHRGLKGVKGHVASQSEENLQDTYASIDIPPTGNFKGHRRNRSVDLDIRDDLGVGHQGQSRESKPVGAKKEFKKSHRRMKSHETITTVFNQPQSQEKDSGVLGSGKSSAESSSGESGSVLKEVQGSSGEFSYTDVDMKDLLQKAEALVTDELPEGWQEVKDGSEIYYWHIWTGTIQYERPVLSTTPSSSSRSLSPSVSDPNSSQSPSVNEQDKTAQSKSPDARPESPQEKPKQAISFPVHSMGWIDVDEDSMANERLAETVNECIASLAEQRKDLWVISETWGEGKDIKLILEGESLKLVEPKSKALLVTQPIAKMRVWGVGKEEQRDFAYIARDQKTRRHRCHMFRCHGNVSGRSIANTLHMICNRVLEEKRRAKERNAKSQRQGSDLLNAPVSSSARSNTSFNEKPYFEQKKCFSAKYVGWTEVEKSSGIDTLNRAVSKLTSVRDESEWRTVLLEITTSEVKTIDCSNQETLMEDRVRFISFLGVAKDQRMCGYIVAVGMDTFVCHVFFCSPHAGTLTRAIEEACKLRYEKFIVKTGEENAGKQPADSYQPQTDSAQESQQHQQSQQRSSTKEGKSSALKSSVQGLFNKLQKRDSKKKLDEQVPSNGDRKSPPLQPGANEYLVKYFGCVEVELGTGIETVQNSVDKLSGGAMMIGYLEVTRGGLTLCDSQRTALSRRVIDLDTVSYCGITSDKRHFGLIVSQGRGKYACHVCEEYKTPVGKIVSAVHDML